MPSRWKSQGVRHDAVRTPAHAVDANDQTNNASSVRRLVPARAARNRPTWSPARPSTLGLRLVRLQVPAPQRSRSVRHEPHATQGQPSARSSSRVTAISSPGARRTFGKAAVGLRRDASASDPSNAPKGSSSSGACLPPGQPPRRFHQQLLRLLKRPAARRPRRAALPDQYGRARRRGPAAPGKPRRKTSGRGTRRRPYRSRGRPAHRRRRRSGAVRRRELSWRGAAPGGAGGGARGGAGRGGGGGAGAGGRGRRRRRLRSGRAAGAPARCASSAASARAGRRRERVARPRRAHADDRRAAAGRGARFEARWRRSVGGGSSTVVA